MSLTKKDLALAGVPVVAVALACAAYAWKAAHASGKVEYCYTVWDEPNRLSWGAFILMGHREWRPDVELGRFPEIQAAVDEAAKRGCPLRIND